VQLLTAADAYMQGVENHLPPAGLHSARAVLEKARTQIGKAGARCRRLVLELRPPELERLGLVGALTNLLKVSGAPRTQVVAKEEGLLNDLPWEDQMVIFRVAQEAIQNIRKHAQANEIELSIAATPEWVHWKIRDDGRDSTRGRGKPDHRPPGDEGKGGVRGRDLPGEEPARRGNRGGSSPAPDSP
jgi:protein-histidine pros-kinase